MVNPQRIGTHDIHTQYLGHTVTQQPTRVGNEMPYLGNFTDMHGPVNGDRVTIRHCWLVFVASEFLCKRKIQLEFSNMAANQLLDFFLIRHFENFLTSIQIREFIKV